MGCRLLAAITALLSLAIIVAEATISPHLPNLSVFSRALHSVKHNGFLVELLTFAFLIYPCMAAYYALYRLGRQAPALLHLALLCTAHDLQAADDHAYEYSTYSAHYTSVLIDIGLRVPSMLRSIHALCTALEALQAHCYCECNIKHRGSVGQASMPTCFPDRGRASLALALLPWIVL